MFGPHGGFGGPHGGFHGPMMGPGFGPRPMMGMGFGPRPMIMGPYYGGYRCRRYGYGGCCNIF